MIAPKSIAQDDKADGLFRLLAVGLRRYSREPATRGQSSLAILNAAVALFAEETSAGDAALAASEAVAVLAQVQRQRQP